MWGSTSWTVSAMAIKFAKLSFAVCDVDLTCKPLATRVEPAGGAVDLDVPAWEELGGNRLHEASSMAVWA